ncbi:DNA primase [Streptococcus suis]|nr:DNA primase [Streptococcus suis]
MITKELINEIKQAVNIVDVIGESVALTKAGRNYLGLCPFHGEKTPSFNVLEDKQFYHCFGCGKSGDVFTFLEEQRGLSFLDAVRELGQQAGFQVDIVPVQQGPKSHHPHQVLLDIHAEAGKFYHALLMTTKMGEDAKNYLHERGLTDQDLKQFQIGLSPSDPNILFQSLSKKFSENDLLQSGLFNTADTNMVYDAFQGRIIFPLTDEEGQIVAFSGRIWTESDRLNKQIAKYKNSRSTAIFNKSYELYHLDQAKASIKKQREVYLMEGYMDVIAAHRAGVENVVASMGTALTREQVQHLAKFCQKVVVAYDGDKAGQAATAKVLEELGQFQVEVVRFPDGMDPDEFLSKNSPQALQDVLNKSRMSQVEFLIHHLRPENPDNLQMQIDFVDRIAPIIANTKSITAQNTYIYKVADLLSDFDYSQVELAVNAVRLHQRQERSRDVSRQEMAPPLVREIPQQLKISPLIRTENHLLYRMQEHAYILNDYRLREDFHFYTPELETLYQVLKAEGEVSSYELAQMEESVQRAWYRVMEERLPEDVGQDELEELEARRQREWMRRENQVKSRTIREQTHVGNDAAALDELAQLIAQKRKME